MKITNIYKTTAALFFLMAAILWPAVDAVGQVTGEKYIHILEVPTNAKVSEAEISAKDDNGTEIAGTQSTTISNVFDRNWGTWWKADSAGPVNIDINYYKEEKTIRMFHISNGTGTNEIVTGVEVYVSEDGTNWGGPIKTFENDDNGLEKDYILDESITTQYLRLRLKSEEVDGVKKQLALHEITIYSGDIINDNPRIKHKHAKWHDLRSSLSISQAAKDMDTFEDGKDMFTPQDNPFIENYPVEDGIQAAHTYIDTIYMHPGTSVTLTLPDKLDNVSVRGYQRWYSFRTDGTYRTKNTGSDKVWDLLTPVQGKSYRFANGYVSKPIDTNVNGTYQMKFYFPTSDEFAAWFDNSSDFDGNWFVVACDVSGYNDYTPEFNIDTSSESDFLETLYEPTLTHRVLYYIASVDGREKETDENKKKNWENGHGRLLEDEYQDGGNAEDKKYLEEYEISFPYTRVSNHTEELVALSKDARAYAIPGVAANSDTEILNVTLIDGDGNQSSGIQLKNNTVEKESRVIQFTYPNVRDDGTKTVNYNNSTATILVTKTVDGKTYNIARYKLKFVADTRLLTQSQLKAIEEGNEDMKYYQFRTPEYLDENYQLLTALNWDYDPEVAESYGQKQYYPFPMAWDYSSYSFFDGSPAKDFVPATALGDDGLGYPEWGYYAIMNNFVENIKNTSAKASPLPDSKYHLYVDASDRPGVIANLPFRQPLCKGSELFVTAWVKSAGFNATECDAGMLFTVMGVEANGRKVPLYRHSSSQIRRTDYLSDQIPGCGTKKNEWLQVYFSFINESDVTYDSYELQVSNNSESTNGGDMYLDDIRVYMATPRATVTQREATCTTKRTLLNIKMDWDRLLSRRGQAELTGDASGWDAIDFCFVDSLAYEEAIKNSLSESAAIDASVVNVWGSDDASDAVKYASLYFNLNFDKNELYVANNFNLVTTNQVIYSYTNNSGSVETGTGNGFYVYEDESGQKYLSVDFYSDLTPNRPYLMLISPKGIDGKVPTVSDFEDIIDDPCGIMTKFWVTSQNIIKINGQIVTPELEYCVGTNLQFTVDLRIPDDDNPGEYEDYTGSEEVYFDWFFGTEEEFLDNTNTYSVSLQEALANFREVYPDAEAVDATETPVNDTKGFTQLMFNLLQEYTTKLEQEHLNPVLTLRKKRLNITLLQDGLNLVVAPIPVTIDDATSTTLQERICWGYTPLTLRTSDKSPKLQPGFNALEYPDEEFNPNLRIGLKQIEAVSGNNSNEGLTVVLRNAEYATKEQGVVDHLGPIINQSFLYLIGTDDQAYTDDIAAATSSYDLPVGWINSLYAKEYGTSSAYKDSIQIRFDLEGTLVENENSDFSFKPKEGYYYTFMIPFEEKGDDGNKVSSACPGMFTLTMKVVPEYMVWEDTQIKEAGETIGNWNNDGNWKRIESERINVTTVSDDNKDYFIDGDNDREAGFVPMLFTKVIMPANSKVELYAAGYTNGTEWNNNSRPSHIAAPTENIQYDLMTFESGVPLRTERYRVSLLDQIHFEPGAEMLHAEYLLYDTAWVDYQLDKGRWYTLASPLKAVYAGDFYTDISGTEGSEYFKDITFNTTDNSRFSPSVYQRAWKGSAAMMVIGNNQNNEERAIAGNWSALYNDVAEAYTPGTGFSLKVQDIADNSSAIFRLPKADGSYKYYPHGDGQSGNETFVSRVEGEEEEKVSGRLRSDTLFIRNTDINKAGKGAPIEITLSETAGGNYYLVGNPFMAHLDMTMFFKEQMFNNIQINNGEVLEWKYWYLDDDGTQVAVTYDVENDVWTSTKTTGDDFLIPPLRSFFVVKNAEVENNVIKFTQKMQTLGGTTDGLRSANALTITATTSDGRTSRAAVAYDMAASADYEASEDAELFLDSNLGDVPMVYTVAGTMATSINRTSELYNIPLGVYGNKQEMVTLSFDGLNQFSSATLYDAQEQTETPLHEGKTVSVPAGTSGRYFLRAGTPTGNEVIARNAFLVYSVGGGKVMVTSSNTPLKDIRVYTMGGAQVRSIQASGMQQEIYLNRGIYLITVSDQDGLQETRKVLVR